MSSRKGYRRFAFNHERHCCSPARRRPHCACRSAGGAPCTGQPCQGDGGRDRHRVRRHRHQPDLRLPRNLCGAPPARAGYAPHLRRAEPDLLVDDAGGDAQICQRHHARRQQGGGGQPRPARPHQPQHRRARQAALDPRHRASRRVRDGAFLWRLDDHTRHLGSVGGRGADGGRARLRAVRAADRGRHIDRPVRHPGPRDGQGRRPVRADHAGLFRCDRGARPAPHSRPPAC